MPIERWLKISLCFLGLNAAAGLLATPFLSLPLFSVVAALFLLESRGDPRQARIGRRLEPFMPAAFLLFLLLDYFLLRSLPAALTRLFLAFLIFKLLNPRAHRDVLWIYLFTLILLFVTATQTTSPVFLAVFAGYLALGSWSWILFHLVRETESGVPGTSATALAETRLVTRRFLLLHSGLALACFFLTLVIFFLIPRIELGSYQALRNPAPISGYANRTSLEGSGAIERDPTIVMRAAFPNRELPRADAHLRWRGTSLDTFDGQAWFQGLSTRRVIERNGREFVLTQPMMGQPLFVQEISLEPIGGRQLFAAPTVMRVQGPFTNLRVDSGDGIVVSETIDQPIRYVAVSDLGSPRAGTLPANDHPIPAKIAERYLALPPVPSRVSALAREIAGETSTPYESAALIERHLKTRFVYRLGVTLTPGADPLEDFLFNRREGHCEYFASSMAVLLRVLGIPSRVVTGFQQGEWNDAGRFMVVRQQDAHAWVEAYFSGQGWVSFDPSPRGDGRVDLANGWWAKTLQDLRLRWNRYIVRYNIGDQIELGSFIRRRLQEGFSQAGRAWNRLAMAVSGAHQALVGLAAICLAGLGLIVWLLRRPSSQAGLFFRRGRRESPVFFYERMLRLLARRGYVPPQASTAREFAGSLARHPAYGPVAEITTLYERVRFGRERLSEAEERRALDLLCALRGVAGEALHAPNESR